MVIILIILILSLILIRKSNDKAYINYKNYERVLEVVDAHTAGEFCRVVIGGIEDPKGNTMIEKKNYMMSKFDNLRSALMLEPRGHANMFGAFLVKPVHKEADFGIIFMDTGGYLNMCGHCTIGATTVILESHLKNSKEGENVIILDAPSGLIEAKAIVKNGKVTSVSFQNVPSFVYKDNLVLSIDKYEIPYTISFGGSFFAIINTKLVKGFPLIDKESTQFYIDIGTKIRKLINENIDVKHPLLNIRGVDLVEFYGDTPNKDKADLRNCVVFGDSQIDRSPCGTGTSAKLATLYKHREIGKGKDFRYESFIGSVFKGKIKDITNVDKYEAVIPIITGTAYLTGYGRYIIDKDDPFKYGFSVKN